MYFLLSLTLPQTKTDQQHIALAVYLGVKWEKGKRRRGAWEKREWHMRMKFFLVSADVFIGDGDGFDGWSEHATIEIFHRFYHGRQE